MSKIGLKIDGMTYERLKWLKTRFEFVYENNMSWDEFFQAIVKDSLLILAQDLINLKKGKLTVNEILELLSGSNDSIAGELKAHMINAGLISRGDISTQ
ncbi:hypothetical protein [Cuniculiplasma divulgatum]|jgi:hypothetical protein|uniref:Uncharacterized protein n=1 Tax=Cuniculiplasma divulgatum TaxID=1673428 RepID=A0A1N5SMH6_9ARCH|nr:hypothetical protein [Cuniculiplasma divulgatum]EQB69215.1 MAG: hypothetical protein AMDU5_GPLC00004G0185 [Thermoplasmatales archaeon Gpl]MCI2413037.1 hypothetical protein [Cuniculiplasma sp.]MCL4319731.1 hypothetical protein [Candidatus Thermoplasmatota archaeon]OWP54967.1 MAG: hypothetical protein B2I18_07150 [Cuniculiplasma sp. C_DKE]WMT48471.1 MAG: hypothetical protein RE472_05185 [Thermoplasmatales archaeon]